MTKENCHYCGSPPVNIMNIKHSPKRPKAGLPRGGVPYIYNGVDRMNSSVGYTDANTVSCCKKCNIAKGKSDYTDFLLWLDRLTRYRGGHTHQTDASC